MGPREGRGQVEGRTHSLSSVLGTREGSRCGCSSYLEKKQCGWAERERGEREMRSGGSEVRGPEFQRCWANTELTQLL